MVALIVAFALIVNYGIEAMRLQTAYSHRRPDDPLSRDPRADLLAGRSPLPGTGAAIQRFLEASDDETIEHQRRITVVAFIAAVVAGVSLLAVPTSLDGPLTATAGVHPFGVLIPLSLLAISFVWARVFAAAAVGPRRRRRLAVISAFAAAAAAAAFALSPSLAAGA